MSYTIKVYVLLTVCHCSDPAAARGAARELQVARPGGGQPHPQAGPRGQAKGIVRAPQDAAAHLWTPHVLRGPSQYGAQGRNPLESRTEG